MAQPNTYKIYLRFFDGTDWYYHTLDSNGAYFANITQTELPHAPEGWKELTASWERGYAYQGMFTAFVTPLKFVLEGATILRHLMFTYGIEAECEIWVEKYNTQTFLYETFFKADLDFSTAVSEDDHVSCAVREGGMDAKIKAKEDTLFEYDIDGNPDVHYIKHDGIELQAKLFWHGIPTTTYKGIANTDYPYLSYIDTEGTNLTLQMYDQNGTDFFIFKNKTANPQLVKLNAPYNINMYADPGIGGASTLRLQYREVNLATNAFTGVDYEIDTSGFSLSAGSSHTYIGDDTQTITLPAGRGISVTIRLMSGASTYSNSFFIATVIGLGVSAYIINRYEETYVPCLKAMDVFKYLAKSISEDKLGVSDSAMTIVSTLLETTYNNEIFIMSGDSLRGLVGSKLKTCLTDFFKFCKVTLGASLYYDKLNNEISLEHTDRAYDSTPNPSVSTITKVSKFKSYPFIQEAFVNFKVGCGNFNYDKKTGNENEITNGKDDPFNTSNWLSPLIKIKKDVDYVSPYRYDPHGIEEIRINLAEKKLADASSDNDVFVIHAENDNSSTYTIPETNVTINYHEIFRTPISVGTWEILNIFSPESIYNIMFTPTRSIDNNGKWFRSNFKMNDSNYLRFQVSSKNNANSVKMQTKTGGVVDFDEGADIQISSLCDDGDEYFYPYVFEFETIEPVNIYNLIEAHPFKTIPVQYNGIVYTVFIDSASSKPADRATSSFKCLVAIDNDITDLIR